jgi:hypothetical protein
MSMSLLGAAAVAMWWDIAPALRSEFEDWHSHEHFPERMSIPGFRRGSRWASKDGGEGFFVLYELETYGTLTSPHYSPAVGQAESLHRNLRPLLARLPSLPGVTGSHLLRTETPNAPATAEQKIRGGDAVADWIILVSGYDPKALEEVAAAELGAMPLEQAGAVSSTASSLYRLSYTLTPYDI